MANDAGTKQDKPSAAEGQGPAPKKGQEAADSAEALAQQESAEAAAGVAPKPKPRRKPAAKKAEGAAAEATGVDKEGAEAALAGADAPGDEPGDTPSAAEPSAAPEAPTTTPRARRSGRRGAGAGVTVQATARYVRSSPRKARLITDHIKGKSVDEARAILAYSPRSVAEDWRKLLESAIANAEHNHDLVGDDLRVLNATADDGPTLKRYQPRAMGRATRIRKRTSHLTITLTPKE
jgi:ribosomal protein L22